MLRTMSVKTSTPDVGRAGVNAGADTESRTTNVVRDVTRTYRTLLLEILYGVTKSWIFCFGVASINQTPIGGSTFQPLSLGN